VVPAHSGPSVRALIVALVVAIVGVLSLDATAIVAAPDTAAASQAALPLAQAPQTPRDQLRLIRWAGQEFLVSPRGSRGPNNDLMTDSTAAVHVDSRGRLHLKVTRYKGKWASVELLGLNPMDYGTYTFKTTGRLARLARPYDLGMFVIRPDGSLDNEIDLENSRALIGMHHGLNAQYVVQPYYQPHHIFRYGIAQNARHTEQTFTWTKADVKFSTKQNNSLRPFAHFHYHGPSAPTNYNVYLHINLFIHGPNHTHVGSGIRSVILDSLTYRPAH